MKLIYHTNAYNSLTNFEYQVNKMNGNLNYVKMLKFASKTREITSGNLFLAGFSNLEPLWAGLSSRVYSSNLSLSKVPRSTQCFEVELLIKRV